MLKRCVACRVMLSTGHFTKDKDREDGLRYACKSCISVRRKQSRRRSIEAYLDIERRAHAKRRTRDGRAPFVRSDSGCPPGHKRCSVCREVKSDEQYTKMPSGINGRRGACRECYGSQRRTRYLASLDRERRRGAEYRAKLGRTLHIRSVLRRRLDPDRARSYGVRSYWRHREKRVQYSRRYRKTEAGRIAERRSGHKRRALKRATRTTGSRWHLLRIMKWADGKCLYCQRPTERLTLDHVVALTNGGTDTPDNWAPACLPCNKSKFTANVEKWANAKFGAAETDRILARIRDAHSS